MRSPLPSAITVPRSIGVECTVTSYTPLGARPVIVSVIVCPGASCGSTGRGLPLASAAPTLFVVTTVAVLVEIEAVDVAVLAVEVGEPVSVALPEFVGEPLAESVGEPLAESVGEALAVSLGEVVAVMVTDAVPVEPANDVVSSGVKTAERLCTPAVVSTALVDATPEATVTEPRETLPSLNCTEPGAIGVSVAVSVKESPCAPEPGVTSSDVDVEVGVTAAVTVTVVEVLVEVTYAAGSVGVKTAVTEYVSAVANAWFNDAAPPDTGCAAPMLAPLAVNCTVPIAVDGDTVADSATVAPVDADVGLASTVVVVVTAGPVIETEADGLVEAVNAVASVGVNTAVTECVPAVENVVLVDAAPETTVIAEPTLVAPSLN